MLMIMEEVVMIMVTDTVMDTATLMFTTMGTIMATVRQIIIMSMLIRIRAMITS